MLIRRIVAILLSALIGSGITRANFLESQPVDLYSEQALGNKAANLYSKGNIWFHESVARRQSKRQINFNELGKFCVATFNRLQLFIVGFLLFS